MDLDRNRLLKTVFTFYFIPWMAFTAYRPIGKQLFDEEWDLAVILDACRADALLSVESEYEFLNDTEVVTSVGSSSKEWMANTFSEQYADEISKTVYLTGNGWVNDVLEEDASYSNWTATKGTWANNNALVEKLLHRNTVNKEDFLVFVPQPFSNIGGIKALSPRELTDFTIHVGREINPDRTIAHYMQPHPPYLHRAARGCPVDSIDKNPLTLIEEGKKDEVWNAYLDNLRYVLDEVEVLLQNFDGDTVITADHGEMFGPSPFIGHAEGIPHPKLKRVPWVNVSSEDTHSRQVDIELPTESEEEIEERLAALGYI